MTCAPPVPDPHAAYTDRLVARRAEANRLDAAIDRIGQLRLAVFLAAIGVAVAAWVTGAYSAWWALAAAVPLLVLVLRSKVLGYRRAAALRAVWYYRHGLDRLAGKWVGRGPTGDRFASPDHLYAADLDLFGDGSLFQRVSAARTAGGEAVLAGWLLAPASADVVRDRQEAVADLRDRLDLREYLAVIGGTVTEAADVTPLVEWGQMPPAGWARWRHVAVVVLGWFNLAAVLGWLFVGTGALPVFIGGLLSALVVWPLVPWAREVARPVEEAANDLPLLGAILARLEQEHFCSARLTALQSSLTAGGLAPSAQVRALRDLAEWSAARRNPMFLPVAIVMLWDVWMAFRLESWRVRSGPLVGRWLASVAELEALGSLAGYAFENPDDPFPEVLPDGPPHFNAKGLGHPLVPAETFVRNDVCVGRDVRLLMVSGSNMSGKSTLLRSVGANAVLALAGAPVRATSLSLTPVALGATMRVQDSLRDGRSRFYAEVTRVRAVLERAKGTPPVLFLFDELFAGTNSSDRLVGAEGVLRALVELGAVGLVTTHDLALTEATTRLGGAANVHFADQLANGEMVFDYTMRP
ncbi:MAG TPA: hypothetical protein VFG68_22925, partial [Fimbriiglobus sp.]|nr:hypothetical protein [Fimbriiglobus sp.]